MTGRCKACATLIKRNIIIISHASADRHSGIKYIEQYRLTLQVQYQGARKAQKEDEHTNESSINYTDDAGDEVTPLLGT